MTVAEMLAQEERSMGRPCKLIQAKQVGGAVTVLVYDCPHDTPVAKGTIRFAVFAVNEDTPRASGYVA